MAAVSVRTATVADAAEIARLQRSTWRTAYAELLPSSALDALDGPETEQAWTDTINSDAAVVLIALEGTWAVGFCAAGPAPEGEVADPDGTVPADAAATALIGTLLVEPRWGRRGHGGRLLTAVTAELRARGADRGITWVADSDSASLAFYRAAGWSPDGTIRTLDTGGDPLREVRLSGPMTAPQPAEPDGTDDTAADLR